ncbi:MAG: hypothetical protein M1352_01080 [Patescibacteria group bacterium]|nr:hypothetical protein [Patescibacteria group bacterium]
MKYILHGEDVGRSRRNLDSIKQRFPPDQVMYLDPQLPQLNVRLFDSPGLYVVEVFDRRQFKKIEPEPFFGLLQKIPKETDVVVWLGLELTPNQVWLSLAKKSGFQEIVSKQSKEVFALVDLFFADPKRGDAKTKFFNKLIGFSVDTGDHIFLAQMLIRRVRQIVWADLGCESLKKLPPFSRRLAEKETRRFSQESIFCLYKELVDLEVRLKTETIDFISALCLIYETH